MNAEQTENIIDLLASDDISGVPAADWSFAASARQHILRTLRTLATSEPAELPRQVAAYQPWCQRLVRYSFRTRTLVNPDDDTHAART
jgi:hypothetical protein